MSTESETQGATDTAVVQPIVAQAAAASPVIVQEPAKTGAKVEMTSDELKRRLDETRSKTREEARLEFLKSFGVSDESALKTAIAEQKRLEDEKRTDLEKRDARIKDLEPKAARVAVLEPALRAIADEQEAALTDAQKKFVSDFGGDDPVARLNAIKALREVLPAAPVSPAQAAPAAQAPKPPIQPGATTAAPAAPAPSGVQSPHVDHLQTWEALKSRPDGGYSAAHYYNHNMHAIIAAQKARS